MIIQSPWPSLRPYPKVPIWEALAQAAAKFPEKAALIEVGGPTSTFRDLWDQSKRVAAYLQSDAQLAKGDVVAVASEGTREFVSAMYGITLAGGVVAPLNPTLGERDLAMQMDDLKPVAAFARGPLASAIAAEGLLGDADQIRHVYRLEDLWSTVQDIAPQTEPVALDPDHDLALLPFSSGTSGLPKGVMLTHSNLVAAWRQRLSVTGISVDSVVFDSRVFHANIRTTIAAGATCVTQPWLDPQQTLNIIATQGVTHALVRPWYLGELVRLKRSSSPFAALSVIESEGDVLFPGLALRARRRFGCPVVQAYHMTEATGSANHGIVGETPPSAVGSPVPDTEERIVDMDSDQEVRLGEIGELQIRGPQIMRGYLRADDLTRKALTPDGWLRTGDIARINRQREVVLVGREKDMFTVHGIPVAPAQVETVLLEHPAVREAAVVGVRLPDEGLVPKAFVVLQDGATAGADELMTFVQGRLAPHKWPRQVAFVTDLPKTANGKLLRRDLMGT